MESGNKNYKIKLISLVLLSVVVSFEVSLIVIQLFSLYVEQKYIFPQYEYSQQESSISTNPAMSVKQVKDFARFIPYAISKLGSKEAQIFPRQGGGIEVVGFGKDVNTSNVAKGVQALTGQADVSAGKILKNIDPPTSGTSTIELTNKQTGEKITAQAIESEQQKTSLVNYNNAAKNLQIVSETDRPAYIQKAVEADKAIADVVEKATGQKAITAGHGIADALANEKVTEIHVLDSNLKRTGETIDPEKVRQSAQEAASRMRGDFDYTNADISDLSRKTAGGEGLGRVYLDQLPPEYRSAVESTVNPKYLLTETTSEGVTRSFIETDSFRYGGPFWENAPMRFLEVVADGKSTIIVDPVYQQAYRGLWAATTEGFDTAGKYGKFWFDYPKWEQMAKSMGYTQEDITKVTKDVYDYFLKNPVDGKGNLIDVKSRVENLLAGDKIPDELRARLGEVMGDPKLSQTMDLLKESIGIREKLSGALSPEVRDTLEKRLQEIEDMTGISTSKTKEPLLLPGTQEYNNEIMQITTPTTLTQGDKIYTVDPNTGKTTLTDSDGQAKEIYQGWGVPGKDYSPEAASSFADAQLQAEKDAIAGVSPTQEQELVVSSGSSSTSGETSMFSVGGVNTVDLAQSINDAVMVAPAAFGVGTALFGGSAALTELGPALLAANAAVLAPTTIVAGALAWGKVGYDIYKNPEIIDFLKQDAKDIGLSIYQGTRSWVTNPQAADPTGQTAEPGVAPKTEQVSPETIADSNQSAAQGTENKGIMQKISDWWNGTSTEEKPLTDPEGTKAIQQAEKEYTDALQKFNQGEASQEELDQKLKNLQDASTAYSQSDSPIQLSTGPSSSMLADTGDSMSDAGNGALGTATRNSVKENPQVAYEMGPDDRPAGQLYAVPLPPDQRTRSDVLETTPSTPPVTSGGDRAAGIIEQDLGPEGQISPPVVPVQGPNGEPWTGYRDNGSLQDTRSPSYLGNTGERASLFGNRAERTLNADTIPDAWPELAVSQSPNGSSAPINQIKLGTVPNSQEDNLPPILDNQYKQPGQSNNQGMNLGENFDGKGSWSDPLKPNDEMTRTMYCFDQRTGNIKMYPDWQARLQDKGFPGQDYFIKPPSGEQKARAFAKEIDKYENSNRDNKKSRDEIEKEGDKNTAPEGSETSADGVKSDKVENDSGKEMNKEEALVTPTQEVKRSEGSDNICED